MQPATTQDFETLTQALLAAARKFHARGDEAPPLVAMLMRETLESGQPVILAIPVPMLQHEALGSAGKDFIGQVLRSSAMRPDVLVAGYLSEAWLSTQLEVSPSQDPGRVETLVIFLLSAECQALKLCEIVRTAVGRELKEQPLQFDTKETPLQGRVFRETDTSRYN